MSIARLRDCRQRAVQGEHRADRGHTKSLCAVVWTASVALQGSKLWVFARIVAGIPTVGMCGAPAPDCLLARSGDRKRCSARKRRQDQCGDEWWSDAAPATSPLRAMRAKLRLQLSIEAFSDSVSYSASHLFGQPSVQFRPAGRINANPASRKIAGLSQRRVLNLPVYSNLTLPLQANARTYSGDGRFARDRNINPESPRSVRLFSRHQFSGRRDICNLIRDDMRSLAASAPLVGS